MRILIMGLPGSGKTTIATRIKSYLDAVHLNADQIRELYDDWDFTREGRIRQCKRMTRMSHEINDLGRNVICDFVCPTEETQQMFDADLVIWMDTIAEGRFEDTNRVFEAPGRYDIRITGLDIEDNISAIKSKIIS